MKYTKQEKKLSVVHNLMIQKCYNPKCYHYKWYGYKSIRVCKEWLENKQSFISWALSNGYYEGLEIDRINGLLDYSPDNCRFVLHIKNLHNRLGPFGNKKLPMHVYRMNGLRRKYPYRVLIIRNGISISTGQLYSSIAKAVKARDLLKLQLDGEKTY